MKLRFVCIVLSGLLAMGCAKSPAAYSDESGPLIPI